MAVTSLESDPFPMRHPESPRGKRR